MNDSLEPTDEQKRAIEDAVNKTFRLFAPTKSEEKQETGMENPQTIELNGKPAFAVIPWKEYKALVTKAKLNASPTQLPDKVVMATTNGDSLIRAWRGYLGMSQGQLAARAGIDQYNLALMEKPNADVDEESMVKLADAMNISMDQLRNSHC